MLAGQISLAKDRDIHTVVEQKSYRCPDLACPYTVSRTPDARCGDPTGTLPRSPSYCFGEHSSPRHIPSLACLKMTKFTVLRYVRGVVPSSRHILVLMLTKAHVLITSTTALICSTQSR
jgi:hypothetical protein